MTVSRIAVLGAGALGSFFGGVLSRKYDVFLIGRKAHVDAVNSGGLHITGETEILCNPKAYESIKDAPPYDLLLITTKSYDTLEAVKQAFTTFTNNAILISLQNGLGNLEAIENELVSTGKRGVVIGGVTSHGVTYVSPGKVRHAGVGETFVGALREEDREKAEEVRSIFESVGIKTGITDNIRGEIWAKAVVNTGINPLTAITRLENGYLLEIPELTLLMERACREAISVAEALGVNLPAADLIEKTKWVARMTAGNKSSMLQDILNGKRSEIDSITGIIVREGERLGVPIPVNKTLMGLVKGIEKKGMKDQ